MHRTYGCSENPGRTRPLCDLCGKKFCQPQKLKVHMRRMHSGKKINKSKFCVLDENKNNLKSEELPL